MGERQRSRSPRSAPSGLLTGKVVIVTGGGGGLGAGIARVCAREGASLIVADIDGDAASKVAAGFGQAKAVACDLRKDAELDRLVAETVATYGRIDGLVNNAGVNFVKPFLETTEDEWERVISLDLRAVFFLTQKVCRHMVNQTNPGGSVVNISSVHSQSCLPGAGPYDAAKWGVVGMGKSFAVELAPKGIRVNAVSPGLLNTQIWQDIQNAAPSTEACQNYWNQNIPIERVIEPDEIGELVAFLLSNRSSSITGANMFADGGMTSQLVSREPYKAKSLTGE